MTEVQNEAAGARTAGNGRRTGDPAKQARKAVLGASDTALEGMRQGHDAAIGAFQRLTDRVVGIPITLLSGDAGSVLSGRAWVDSAFETTETLWTAQRQFVDQLLANQRELVGTFVESGFELTKAMWQGPRRARDTDQD